ncbi:MAG: LuxR C-terminal-related transcriptional regulator, partial [Coriobacteriaceae bacterium]|nr:LuxR C-terminal-related transcriptional regulator [Coriobacteriaceae bacterium]
VEQLLHAVRPDRRSEPDRPAEAGAPNNKLEVNCGRVAKAFRLTPREGEVLVLLAHGRTLSIIARDLFVAKGTARTHMENIYRKLDVHKQQELIDLVEQFGP